jgi:hypothetical protein
VLSLAAVLVLSSACYHVTVETGLPASNETITKTWAHAFLGGLVPPQTVETASKCKNGVAKVESQMSPLNLIASMLTYSIYSPMQIEVTCASSNKTAAVESSPDARVRVVHDDAPDAVRKALEAAIIETMQKGGSTLVMY